MPCDLSQLDCALSQIQARGSSITERTRAQRPLSSCYGLQIHEGTRSIVCELLSVSLFESVHFVAHALSQIQGPLRYRSADVAAPQEPPVADSNAERGGNAKEIQQDLVGNSANVH
jgi:hypothetical protein